MKIALFQGGKPEKSRHGIPGREQRRVSPGREVSPDLLRVLQQIPDGALCRQISCQGIRLPGDDLPCKGVNHL